MALIRRATPTDLFKLNLCNLDHLTENYDLSFYFQYLMKWPSLFMVLEDHGNIVGYSKFGRSSLLLLRSRFLAPLLVFLIMFEPPFVSAKAFSYDDEYLSM